LSVDLGRSIAGTLGVPFEPVLYPHSSPFTKSFARRTGTSSSRGGMQS
jgi:hypothetical protein